MNVFRLIGEPKPTIREADLLTMDHPLRPYPPKYRVRFSSLLRAVVFAVALVIATILVSSVWLAVQGDFDYNKHPFIMPLWELLTCVLAYIILVIVMEGRPLPYEVHPRRILGLLKGMALGFIIISVCVGILAVIGVYRITGFNAAYDPWMDLLSAGLTAAVAEEILMRGVLFRLSEEGLGTWGAVIVSAAVFGLSHLSNADGSWWGSAAIAIEAGILLAAVYIITRSLWWCIGLHFAWNVTEGPVFGSIISGNGAQHSWFTSTWAGPDILTGGSFGLEGSIVPVILCGVLGIALLVYAWRNHLMVSPITTRKALLTQGSIRGQEGQDLDPAM